MRGQAGGRGTRDRTGALSPMRILLISANRERVPYPVLPIGLAAVASSLEAAGHDVRFLDLCFSRAPELDAARAAAELKPGLIGLSLRNLDNCDFEVPKDFVPEARRLASACRAAGDAPIAVGGSAVGVMPEAVLRATGADFAVAGDGERTAVALANALEHGEDPEALPGLWIRRGEDIRPGARDPVQDLSALPLPRIHRWIDPGPYLRHEGVYPLQSKRGCALGCIYCTYVNLEGRSYRFRSGESVADEVEEVLDLAGISDFEFVDSTFNAPPSHALEVCRALARRRLGARFIGNGMNPVATTTQLLDAMREAGFHALVSTAESASDAVLANLKKGFTRAHLEQVARASRASGMPNLWIFLLGGPGEDRNTVLETLDFFQDAAGPGDVAYLTSGVRIYPDTALEEIALREGFIRDRRELISPSFYFSPGLDRAWLRNTLTLRARKDPRLMTSAGAQSRLIPAGLRLLSTLGVRKPFWRFAPAFNRALRLVG